MRRAPDARARATGGAGWAGWAWVWRRRGQQRACRQSKGRPRRRQDKKGRPAGLRKPRIIAHEPTRTDPGRQRQRHRRLQQPAAAAPRAGQPGPAELPGHDAHTGRQPAAGAGRQRPHRPGAHRQRQDGRLRAGPAGQPEHPPPGRAGPGAVPHARTGRPGDAGTAPPGRRRRQHQDPHPLRWRHHAPADRQPGARRARGGGHTGPPYGPPGARQPEPGGAEHPGAGRSRPHAGHGLLRRHPQRGPAVPQGAPDAAVFRHLPRRHRQAQRGFPAPPAGGEAQRSAQGDADPPGVLRSEGGPAPARGGSALEPLPPAQHRGRFIMSSIKVWCCGLLLCLRCLR